MTRAWLRERVNEARGAVAVVVPSRCTVDRVRRYVSRDVPVHVVKAPVHLWEAHPTPSARVAHLNPGGYVVDVMRRYEDPFADACRQACARVGVPCVETRCGFGWDEFRWTIANAALLVSAVQEASTGGLTLLEGYAHGVPVLMSDSRWHGGRDYFGDRAYYFGHDSLDSLVEMIRVGMGLTPFGPPPGKWVTDPAKTRRWVRETYSEARFAGGLADVFREVLGV